MSDEIPVPSELETAFQKALAKREAWEARLKEPLSEEDLTTCPACGVSGDFWLREIGKRVTWQPFALEFDPENGLVEGEYLSFDYADDVLVDYFECGDCSTQWADLNELQHALVSAMHARADASYLEQMLVDETKNALAVLVCHTGVRLTLERNDPDALAQAREALGLPVQVPKKEEPHGE
jgi:hypothetical protein